MRIIKKYNSLHQTLLKKIFKNVNSIEIIDLSKKDTSLQSFIIKLKTIINDEEFIFNKVSNNKIIKKLFYKMSNEFWEEIFNELEQEIQYIIKYKVNKNED